MNIVGNGPTNAAACHCRRNGIGPHWHSLREGCPVGPVAARTPCAHGKHSFCDTCWNAACTWLRLGEGCTCTEDDPRERALSAAAESADERAVSGPERRTSRVELQAYLDELFAGIKHLNATKGADYTGADDALANLRDMPRAGITGRQKWLVYFEKHYRAIETYVRDGQVESEPIESRIQDAILYLALLGALVREEQGGAAVERDGAA